VTTVGVKELTRNKLTSSVVSYRLQ